MPKTVKDGVYSDIDDFLETTNKLDEIALKNKILKGLKDNPGLCVLFKREAGGFYTLLCLYHLSFGRVEPSDYKINKIKRRFIYLKKPGSKYTELFSNCVKVEKIALKYIEENKEKKEVVSTYSFIDDKVVYADKWSR